MAVPDHPMRALKGTKQAKQMMDGVRSHRGGAKPDAVVVDEPRREKSYREIADKHVDALTATPNEPPPKGRPPLGTPPAEYKRRLTELARKRRRKPPVIEI